VVVGTVLFEKDGFLFFKRQRGCNIKKSFLPDWLKLISLLFKEIVGNADKITI